VLWMERHSRSGKSGKNKHSETRSWAVPSLVTNPNFSYTSPHMSSVSHNTRSQANPNQPPPAVSQKTKITPTKVPRQGIVEKGTSGREAAINELVDTEARIAANRAANLRSLARPLLNDDQADEIGEQASNIGDLGDHARGSSRGGGGDGGNHGQRGGGGRGRGSRGSGLGPVQVAMTNDGQSGSVTGPGESDMLCVLYVPEANLPET
jgi:hypothetical protein